MSTTPSITTELNDQLASAQQRKAAAEEQLGAAVLDGGKVKTIEKALVEAKADVDRLAAALETAEEREIEKGEQEAQEAARQERIAIYASIRDYLPLIAEVVERRQALKHAEAALKDNSLHRRARVLLLNGAEKVRIDGETTLRLITETELDHVLLAGTPCPKDVTSAERITITVERCRELVARADELIAAEGRGEGAAATVTGAEWLAERKAQKQARQAERVKCEAEQRQRAQARPKTPAKGRGGGSSVPEVLGEIERQEAGLPG